MLHAYKAASRLIFHFLGALFQSMLNYYEVLALPSPAQEPYTVTKQDIKLAYRRALLQHHPDKSTVQECPPLAKPKYTVDEITTAYKILSDASGRSEFDRQLRLHASQSQKTAAKPLSGLETVDLDDLEYDDATGVWYRPCRCGNERGYLITEDDLEEEAEHGDIITGCGGCSIWLKVVFQSMEGA